MGSRSETLMLYFCASFCCTFRNLESCFSMYCVVAFADASRIFHTAPITIFSNAVNGLFYACDYCQATILFFLLKGGLRSDFIVEVSGRLIVVASLLYIFLVWIWFKRNCSHLFFNKEFSFHRNHWITLLCEWLFFKDYYLQLQDNNNLSGNKLGPTRTINIL